MTQPTLVLHLCPNTVGPSAWDPRWYRKRRIGRQTICKMIKTKDVKNLEEAWLHARVIGRPLNRFVTIRPVSINRVPPAERSAFWYKVKNKFAQFARDHGFEPTFIWARESDAPNGMNEHIHVLMHVPRKSLARFDEVVPTWFSAPGETHVQPATYQQWRLPNGKLRRAIGYLLKNSPRAAWKTWRGYKKGGPIAGKRAGCSRNIDQKARSAWSRESVTNNPPWRGADRPPCHELVPMQSYP
jgi:hypothetical protein